MVIAPELDPSLETPLYRQLSDYFKALIDNGKLMSGERIPATRELAGMLGLNRATISAAYEMLEASGLITGQVGRGSFVAGQPARRLNWTSLLGESEPAGPPALGKDAISFATSRPAEELFPVEMFRATCREVLEDEQVSGILQLGSPSGYAPFRQFLLEEARRRSWLKSGDDVMVTTGCQQALDLLQRVLIKPGDHVVLEDPVYPGLKNLLARAGARLTGVPVGSEGIELEQLERVLSVDRPKLLVLTPNFQNPTGVTLSLSARKSILGMVRRAGVVLIENDTYGDLQYSGESLPAIKELDEAGDTVLLRSFSKVAFPGLRVGWVTGPRPLLARLAEAKHLSDLHSDQLSQAVVLRFARSGRLEEHQTRILQTGAERLKAVLEACERDLPAGTQFTRPRGGMNLWVRLPAPLDAGELLPRAQRENVNYLPGKFFAVSKPQPGGLRLSFAGLEPNRIREGIGILGDLFSRELERTRAAQDAEPVSAMV